jgi:hypothetical protein
VTLCTDVWLMCGVTLRDEYWLDLTELVFTREVIDKMILDAFAGAFLPWPVRRALIARVASEVRAYRCEASGCSRPPPSGWRRPRAAWTPHWPRDWWVSSVSPS